MTTLSCGYSQRVHIKQLPDPEEIAVETTIKQRHQEKVETIDRGCRQDPDQGEQVLVDDSVEKVCRKVNDDES